jgi:uncharacterized protein with HEPN domain
MQREDEIRIRHMIEAANTMQGFIAERKRSDLDTDQMLSFALARAIEIIGEAASKVSPETRSATPFVPWVQVIAMRNRLIHAYYHIDNDVIWKTVTEEVPELLLALLTIVPKD